ncbi:GtrA family protein [Polynucleobacter kasalickyi]|uniref:Putative flippase GtrA (Transmembrane translocase of bactoprenol-linked glucose) n=1 Tax=Polynucleobacter kasalickyi TaxID=1938817 RepID=A0A1W1Y1S5_9BURK|nr:GtrA family protein [Polynucleobacter kasalickyi]SMC30085.1 Putative flippase GtrA (transmembrane translocase of bactoprenol-linked glucose) [Polynucleobacter kasalickyi]
MINTKLRVIFQKTLSSEKARYLIVGGWNTLFGYFAGLLIYGWLGVIFNVIIIGFIANVLAISMAYVTNKIFVFKTKGNWTKEYIKAWILYGSTTMIGIILLWVLVDIMEIRFWVAQGLVTIILIITAYIGNLRFTFK